MRIKTIIRVGLLLIFCTTIYANSPKRGPFIQVDVGRAAWTHTKYNYEGYSHRYVVQDGWNTISNSPNFGFEGGYQFDSCRASLSYDDFYDFEMRFDVADTVSDIMHTNYSAPANSKIILANVYADSPNLGGEMYPANLYLGLGAGISVNRFGESAELNHADVESAIINPNTYVSFAAKFDVGFRIKIFYHTYLKIGNKLFFLGKFKSGTTQNVVTGSGNINYKRASTADSTFVDEPYVGIISFF